MRALATSDTAPAGRGERGRHGRVVGPKVPSGGTRCVLGGAHVPGSGLRHMRPDRRSGQERHGERTGSCWRELRLCRGDEPRGLRELRGTAGGRRPYQQELRPVRQKMRVPFHLREAGLRHLLSDEQHGRDPVPHQAGWRQLQRPQGRERVRRGRGELLRRGLRATADDHDLEYDPPAVRVQRVPDLRWRLRRGAALRGEPGHVCLRVRPRRQPALHAVGRLLLQWHLRSGRAMRDAVDLWRLRVRARRQHAVRAGGRHVQRRQLPSGTNLRPAEHAVAHLLHLRADGRAVLCRRNYVRARADVQRRPRHVPVLPTVKRRSHRPTMPGRSGTLAGTLVPGPPAIGSPVPSARLPGVSSGTNRRLRSARRSRATRGQPDGARSRAKTATIPTASPRTSTSANTQPTRFIAAGKVDPFASTFLA